MNRRTLTLVLTLFVSIAMLAQGNVRTDSIRQARRTARQQVRESKDTIPARYPVAKTVPDNIDDLKRQPMDLRNPDNIISDTIYNEKDGTYSIATRLGEGSILGTPLLLDRNEYSLWHEKKQMQGYFRKKGNEEWENSKKKDKFDFTDATSHVQVYLLVEIETVCLAAA